MGKLFPFYGVAQLVSVSAGDIPDTPFYVFETFMSIDGPRTRVARGGFKTEQEAKNWIKRNQDSNLGRDAADWRKITALIGHWQDGSAETVKLGWDDATRTAFIGVGNKGYSGASFSQILAEIPDPEAGTVMDE